VHGGDFGFLTVRVGFSWHWNDSKCTKIRQSRLGINLQGLEGLGSTKGDLAMGGHGVGEFRILKFSAEPKAGHTMSLDVLQTMNDAGDHQRHFRKAWQGCHRFRRKALQTRPMDIPTTPTCRIRLLTTQPCLRAPSSHWRMFTLAYFTATRMLEIYIETPSGERTIKLPKCFLP
jgi:hypothetical protein